ncbi:MAG: hypothetical protein KJ057_03645 [Phycisphaerae bacterium]|nr:MAG: hypothetical protein F9K17_05295 [Phycisphaerae bacterium]MBE7457744.1 hypothetical protein [Planctomycetia bacterium]MCK6463737.1 hypothetical protein [Phycisphaerae bacterium]MCL4717548.1 hypothetical protein [Phycisphaerae bacterium]NUQ08433.1 hypothetical protein [Phycisphaerae bacterium]
MIRQLAGHVAHHLTRLLGGLPTSRPAPVSKRVFIGAAAILILVVAVLVYSWRSGGGDQTVSREFGAVLRCMKCGHSVARSLDVADAPPFSCSDCGAQEAWFLKKCHACGELFLPPLEGDPPRQPMIPSCTRCGSQATGAASTKEAP